MEEAQTNFGSTDTLSSVFEIRIKVVCATEALVSSALFLLLEDICFVFH